MYRSTDEGLYIAFEGVDGSGKSAVAAEVFGLLRERGYRVTRTSEPEGWTVLGKAVNDVLSSISNLTPMSQFFLYSAARDEIVSRRIRPWLEEGRIVLSDRSFYSSLVYQGFLGGVEIEFLLDTTLYFVGRTVPNVVVWIDVDPSVAASRIALRHTSDVREHVDTDRIAMVNQAYRQLSRNETLSKWLVYDNSSDNYGDVITIADDIVGKIEQFYTGVGMDAF